MENISIEDEPTLPIEKNASINGQSEKNPFTKCKIELSKKLIYTSRQQLHARREAYLTSRVIPCIEKNKYFKKCNVEKEQLRKPKGDIGLYPKETLLRTETSTSAELSNNTIKSYEVCKESLSFDFCIKKLFSNEAYISELSAILKPLPQHSMTTYQYRLNNIEELAKEKLIQIKPYTSNFYIVDRKKVPLFGSYKNTS